MVVYGQNSFGFAGENSFGLIDEAREKEADGHDSCGLAGSAISDLRVEYDSALIGAGVALGVSGRMGVAAIGGAVSLTTHSEKLDHILQQLNERTCQEEQHPPEKRTGPCERSCCSIYGDGRDAPDKTFFITHTHEGKLQRKRHARHPMGLRHGNGMPRWASKAPCNMIEKTKRKAGPTTSRRQTSDIYASPCVSKSRKVVSHAFRACRL